MTISDNQSVNETFKKTVSFYRKKYPAIANDIEDILQDIFVSVLRIGHAELNITYLHRSIENQFRKMLSRQSHGLKGHVSIDYSIAAPQSRNREVCLRDILPAKSDNLDLKIDTSRAISKYPTLKSMLLDCMDREEIAKRDGVTPQAVSIRITKELKKLQAELRDYGKTLNNHDHKRLTRPVQGPDCVANPSPNRKRFEA